MLSIDEVKYTIVTFKVERLHLHEHLILLKSQFVRACSASKITNIANTYTQRSILFTKQIF